MMSLRKLVEQFEDKPINVFEEHYEAGWLSMEFHVLDHLWAFLGGLKAKNLR